MANVSFTESAARQLLQAVDIPGDVVMERVLEGGGHQTWYVGSDMVLRLASCEDGDATEIRERQKRDAAIRKHLISLYSLREHAQVIPASLVLKAVEDHSNIASFCIDRRIQGTSLEKVPVTSAVVDGLVCLLEVLRSVSKAYIQRLGLPEIPLPNPDKLMKDAYRAWERLADNERIEHCLQEYDFTKIIEGSTWVSDSSWPLIERPVVLHGDLKGEHILVSPVDRTVVGILDWEDAGIGHPAIDINGLVISVGASYAADIGRRAGYGRDVVLAGIFLARCETVLRLDDRLHGEDKDSPEELLKAQLERAFEQVEELS